MASHVDRDHSAKVPSLRRWLKILLLRFPERFSGLAKVFGTLLVLLLIYCTVFLNSASKFRFQRLKGFKTSALQQLVSGRHIFVITHEMSMTGAPRVCADLVSILHQAGAEVTLSVGYQGLGRPAEFSGNDDTYFAQRVSNTGVPLGFKLDVGASFDAAARADVVIVSTADPRQRQWIERFRQAYPEHSGLVWWIHEGASVMRVFDTSATDDAVRVITDGTLDGLVMVSAAAQKWWTRAIVEREIPLLADTLPPTHIVYWGIPWWRQNELDFSTRKEFYVLKRSQMRETLGIAAGDFVFAVLASFHPIKGHSGIVRALMKAQDVFRTIVPGIRLHLVAAGAGLGSPGHFPPEGMEWVKDDTTLHFLPPTQDVAAFMVVADAYVSNTKFGGETWGLATLEALIAGLPLLASGVGGTLEQVEHNVTALIHDMWEGEGSSEYHQLAEHMLLVATDESLRERIRTAGQKYAWNHLAQVHIEESLVNTLAGFLVDGRRHVQ